ncbi:MAG: hypothetical protein P8L47_02165 [Candidatus Marinamargulisbacteria bacterium]|jgi:hypothetical protein|nr:hypothetical protein [Candidatus Marinamargulisbacteria bacterium]|tara:strand:+ start:294 stop:791 length:498 start_codon:yes stop_codon:yes gene_type:complete
MSNIPGINPSAMPNSQSSGKKSTAGQESIKGLTDDMAGVLSAGKTANLNSESAAPIQGKTPQHQQSTNQEDAMLVAMAALDELVKKDKQEKSTKNQSFSDKLRGFKSIRNQLEGVQLNNPEEQAIVEEFMRNYDTISRKYNQLKNAKDQLEALKKKHNTPEEDTP